MLHISVFRVQKYAGKGGFPLSLKFYIVYALLLYGPVSQGLGTTKFTNLIG